MGRRKPPRLRAARRHAFVPTPRDLGTCQVCPAPEENLTFHPPIRFFRDDEDREQVLTDARAQLQQADEPYTQSVIEEAWLWLTRLPHTSASDLEVAELFAHDAKASERAITAARRALEATGQLERVSGHSFHYADATKRTGHRHPHYARPITPREETR